MYTQCPHCQTTFRIAEAHLKAAKGMVRCGSCQQIFDATAYLSSGVPEEPPSRPSKPKPAPPPAAAPTRKPPKPPSSQSLTSNTFSFEDFDEEEHEHIDLTTPITRGPVPDQTPFMESIYDENSPYNNLDEMDRIPIPGELNFGDSFIKVPEDESAQDKRHNETQAEQPIVQAEPDRRPPNLYEDLDDKEAPATTMERSAIDELYKSADLQMQEDEQLQKNIEELLTFASDLDNRPPSHPDYELSPHLHELEDFEKEIDSLDLYSPEKTAGPTKEKPAPPPASGVAGRTDDEEEFAHDFKIEFDENEQERATAPEATQPATEAIEPEPKQQSSRAAESARQKPRVPRSVEDELPSAEFEIPKALRRNFENVEPPIRPIGQTMGMIALVVILAVGFLFQLVLFRSYELANRFHALAPLLTSICSSLPCRYSGSIDVSKIELINRDVRSHPTQKNALLISAAFINNASFDQPYPTIAVKLSDLSGNIVATRHFKPEEYLDRLYSKFLLMESGTPIHITLAVLDPGDDAINFEFSFL